MYRVVRHTWGAHTKDARNDLYTGNSREDCQSFIDRDKKRMGDIGFSYVGNNGFRQIDGQCDYCSYVLTRVSL